MQQPFHILYEILFSLTAFTVTEITHSIFPFFLRIEKHTINFTGGDGSHFIKCMHLNVVVSCFHIHTMPVYICLLLAVCNSLRQCFPRFIKVTFVLKHKSFCTSRISRFS